MEIHDLCLALVSTYVFSSSLKGYHVEKDLAVQARSTSYCTDLGYQTTMKNGSLLVSRVGDMKT